MTDAQLADQLAGQPALCAELVYRLGRIAQMPPNAATAATVAAWAADFRAAVERAPVPAPPGPDAPATGRPQVRVYCYPGDHEIWEVAPESDDLARRAGLIADADAGYVWGSHFAARARQAAGRGVDTLITAMPPGQDPRWTA